MDPRLAIPVAMAVTLPATIVALYGVRRAGIETSLSIALMGGSALLFALVTFSGRHLTLGSARLGGEHALVSALVVLLVQALVARIAGAAPATPARPSGLRFLEAYDRVCRLAASGSPEPERIGLVRLALADLAAAAPFSARPLVLELAADVAAWEAGSRSSEWWRQREARLSRRLADLLGRPR